MSCKLFLLEKNHAVGMTGCAVEAVTVGHADGRDLVDIALFEALAPVPRDLIIHVSAATPMLTSARRDWLT